VTTTPLHQKSCFCCCIFLKNQSAFGPSTGTRGPIWMVQPHGPFTSKTWKRKLSQDGVIQVRNPLFSNKSVFYLKQKVLVHTKYSVFFVQQDRQTDIEISIKISSRIHPKTKPRSHIPCSLLLLS
jgi:hypothetical protein